MVLCGWFVAALHLKVQLRTLQDVSTNMCNMSIYYNSVRNSIVAIMCDCIIMSLTYIWQDAGRCWWSTIRMATVISHSYRRRSSLIRCRVMQEFQRHPRLSPSRSVQCMSQVHWEEPECFQTLFRFVEELCAALWINWLCIFCVKCLLVSKLRTYRHCILATLFWALFN